MVIRSSGRLAVDLVKDLVGVDAARGRQGDEGGGCRRNRRQEGKGGQRSADKRAHDRYLLFDVLSLTIRIRPREKRSFTPLAGNRRSADFYGTCPPEGLTATIASAMPAVKTKAAPSGCRDCLKSLRFSSWCAYLATRLASSPYEPL